MFKGIRALNWVTVQSYFISFFYRDPLHVHIIYKRIVKYHDNLNCSTRRGFLEREYCTGTKLSKGKRLFILKFHPLLNFFDSLRSSLED